MANIEDFWNSTPTELSPNQPANIEDFWNNSEQVTIPQAKVQAPTRSVLMEPITSVIAGVTDLAEQYARAYRLGDVPEVTDEEPGHLGQFANWLIINKDQFEKDHPYIYAPVAGESEPRRWVREGVRSLIPSLGAGIPGMLLGAAAGGGPTPTGALGAVLGYATSGGTIFGMAEYDQFVQDVLKYNQEHPDNPIPKELYGSEAFKSAVVEGGLEGLSDLIEGSSFGMGKLLTKPVKETVRSILKQGWKGSAKNFLVAQAKAQPAEVGTEFLQNYGETALRQNLGIDTEVSPLDAAISSLGPTVVSTLLMGAGFHAIDTRQRSKIAKALEDPTTDFDTRFNAMKTIYDELRKTDKEDGTDFANKWGEIAQFKLLENEPIDIDKKLAETMPLGEMLKERELDTQNKVDVEKFIERGKPKEEKPEEIPADELEAQRLATEKPGRQIYGLETRQYLYDKFIEQGFGPDRANELAATIMGARGPQEAVQPTVPSTILDEAGKPIQKPAPQDSTSGTNTLTRGQTLISKLPENLRTQLIVSAKGTPFSTQGGAKTIIKKQGKETTHSPFMVAEGEWVGAPSGLAQQVWDLQNITAGNMQRPIITGTQTPVQGARQATQTPVAQQAPTYTNPHPDDLTNKGKPFTNKVSAKLAIQRLYKQIQYTGTEEKMVPFEVAKGQWVGRRKEIIPVEEHVETPREYVNRRNAEFIEANAKSPAEGIAKLDEIIQGMKDEGHDASSAFKQTVQRREMLVKQMERAAKREEVRKAKEAEANDKKNRKRVPVEKQDNGQKPQQAQPVVGASEAPRETGTVVQEPGGAPGTEGQGAVREGEGSNQAAPGAEEIAANGETTPLAEIRQKVEKIRAKNVEKRLRAGEDVPDEEVKKFKTLALRWSKNDEGKWEEHEPKYLARKTLSQEEREQRADARAIARAEKQPKKVKQTTTEEAVTALEKRIDSLNNKLDATEDPDEKLDIKDEIEAARRDIDILSNRLEKKPSVRWFGENEGANHPLAKNIMYASPEQVDLQIDAYSQETPDTGQRMLRKMDPAYMPRALVMMMNYALHYQDGSVDLNTIGKFLDQLDKALKDGRLDSYLTGQETTDKGTTDDRKAYADQLTSARDYLGKVTDEVFKQQKPRLQRDQSTKGRLTDKQVLAIVDKVADKWENAPYTVVVPSREYLPDEVRQLIASGPDNQSRIGGAFFNDTIFLVADELRDADDVRRAMLHEAIGHYGIQHVLGKNFNPVLRQIYASVQGTQEMKDLIKLYGFKETEQVDAAAEYLAKYAERLAVKDPSLLQRVLARVREILRDLGFNLRFSDNDIVSLLNDSRRFVEATPASTSVENHFGRYNPQLEATNTAPPFYSALINTVMKRTDMPTKPQSLLNWLNKYVKPAELKWMGVEQYLKGKDKVDKQDFISFLQSNQINLEEVTRGEKPNRQQVSNDIPQEARNLYEEGALFVTKDDQGNYHSWHYVVDEEDGEYIVNVFRDEEVIHSEAFENEDVATETGAELTAGFVDNSDEVSIDEENGTVLTNADTVAKYAQYTLPGGQNYKELLLTWNPGKALALSDVLANGGKPSDVYQTLYSSAHWSEPNVLGHVRFNERTDAQGRRVLFIEEVQSDWLQAAKEHGFNGTNAEEIEKYKKYANNIRQALKDLYNGRGFLSLDPDEQQKSSELNDTLNDLILKIGALEREGVPRAPFLENWHEVFMKRMIRYAADNGFDAIAWTTGKQQADRYNLAKYFDTIKWDNYGQGKEIEIISKQGDSFFFKVENKKVVSDNILFRNKTLDEVVGDSLSNKIINNEDGELSGLDLQIGGEGMRVFYDQKLKGFTEKYIKQWGGKLETIQLPQDSLTWNEADDGTLIGATPFGNYAISDFDPNEWQVWMGEYGGPDYRGLGKYPSLNEAKQAAYNDIKRQDKSFLNGIALQQPGFILPAKMKEDVIEKGQPWFRRVSSQNSISSSSDQTPRLTRVVDFQDITPQTTKRELKDLFNDQAYAALKALAMQLPKNQPSMHWAQRYLLSPEWYNHPTLQKIVKAAIDRHDRYYELFNILNELGIDLDTKKQIDWQGHTSIIDANVALRDRGLTTVQKLKGETSKEYKDLERMKDEIDTGEWKRGYGENEPTWEQHFSGQGVSEDVISLYKLHRKAYDKALDFLMQPMQELVKRIEAQAEKDKTKPKYPEFMTLDDEGKPVKINLKAVLASMGQLKGTYAPRLREPGDYEIRGVRGDKHVRYHKPNRMAAEALKRDLERKGYKIEPITERERLPEDVYSTLRIINTQKAIETAMKGMDDFDPELQAKFNEELLREVADLIRVRGFRSSMIARKPGAVIRGYITDPNERFVRYINNISAGIAKGEAAKEMFHILAGHYETDAEGARKKVGGIDPGKERRAYDTATKYIEEQLRNSDAADRVVGLVKSFASFKYLGFNLRSPIVNVLSLGTTVPTAIHQYALDGKGSLVKIGAALAQASNDYRMVMTGKKLSDKGEQMLLDEIKQKGYDTPQYTRDALGTIQRAHGKAWSRTLYWSMYIFGKSEQWIRGTTMLAAYRLMKAQNKDMGQEELSRKAHDVSNKAHGIYGKSTQLALGQGTGPTARLTQIYYTFGKFSHNYLQMLYDTGIRKGNVKAFVYGLISPIVLGGAMVVPFKDAAFKLLSLLLSAFGVDWDPEKAFWDWVRKQFGMTTEKIGRHGLLGAANLDVSSSMSIGVGVPRNFYEIFGVAGGLAKDFADAKHFLEIGQPGRAAEKALPTSVANVFRAIRELNGITTTKGQTVFDDKGQPYKPSGLESLIRAVPGIRTANEATMAERTWETKREIQSYATRREAILESWRDYVTRKGSKEDLKGIMDKIKEYNDAVIKAKKAGQIPLIKRETLKSQAKSLYKPSNSMYMGLYNQ